ncbi:MAG TPA: DUF2335 domain-containing protein [Thermovirgaceae bacterium]|nr:DUF2335 domain-containing protein [Thermovirgaceae bacterium]
MTKPGKQQGSGLAIRHEEYSGILPRPGDFSGYESVLPGSAERILKMAEEQSMHRREMEKIVIRSRSRDSLCGIICGFLIGVTTVLSGAFCIIKGHPYPGTFLGTAGLVGLVGVFIYGTSSNRKEREQKFSQR